MRHLILLAGFLAGSALAQPRPIDPLNAVYGEPVYVSVTEIGKAGGTNNFAKVDVLGYERVRSDSTSRYVRIGVAGFYANSAEGAGYSVILSREELRSVRTAIGEMMEVKSWRDGHKGERVVFRLSDDFEVGRVFEHGKNNTRSYGVLSAGFYPDRIIARLNALHFQEFVGLLDKAERML